MTHLEKGDPAPNIEGIDQNGNSVKLSSFIGKKVIIFFYPKDNTPGCTAEACNLRDNYGLLIEKGFSIIGISADNLKSHQKFADKFQLPFPLISDTEKKIIREYGVWGPKKFMGREYDGIHRTTFIVTEDGHIDAVFTKVKTKDHTNQILNELGY